MISDLKATQQNVLENRLNFEIEYAPNSEDTDQILEIKLKIQSLPEHQKRIFLMYVDMGSYSAVARELNCSAPTVAKYIKQIIKDLDINN